MSGLMFLLCIWALEGEPTKDVTVLHTYETVKGMGLPGSIDFDEKGRLYMVDQLNSKVSIWDAERKLVKTFGEKGPEAEKGEMRNPVKIAVGQDLIWVWARNQFVFIFDKEGNFKKPIRFSNVWPKALAILDKDHVLLGTEILRDGQLEMKVLLAKAEQELVELVGFPNDMLLGVNQDDVEQKMTAMAFGPDMDFQVNEKGNWYIGFGGAPFLFRVDKTGNITGQVPIELPPVETTAAEREYVKKAKFKVWSGQAVALEDDQTRLRFGPKASFTQFTLKGDKALFVTTATGGYITDLYAPSDRGTYRVMDMKTGNIETSGAYNFPADSKVFFRRGRIIGAIVQEDGSYKVSELSFKGW